jgi:hypothetical protein
MNELYYGDNLDVLRRYVPAESVDLVYLDPPFNSRQDYNVLFAEKDGKGSSSQIHDLVGVLNREDAEMGVFLCFEPPTKPMLREAAEAGLYKSTDGSTYPRLQILTIQQILNGKQPEFPRFARDATFKKAPKAQASTRQSNLSLFTNPGD